MFGDSMLCCFQFSGQSVRVRFASDDILTLICTRLSFSSVNCFGMHCASCRKIFFCGNPIVKLLFGCCKVWCICGNKIFSKNYDNNVSFVITYRIKPEKIRYWDACIDIFPCPFELFCILLKPFGFVSLFDLQPVLMHCWDETIWLIVGINALIHLLITSVSFHDLKELLLWVYSPQESAPSWLYWT